MSTKKIDELPVSNLTAQEALNAYMPISGIGGDGDELQRITFANLKSMLLDNREVEPHEYWRVFFDANNSTAFCGLTELQFFKANSVTNAVSQFGGTPMASGGTAALAFDNGASATGWNDSGTSGAWIGYHFNKAVGIARVRITAAQFTDQSPKDFRVQYSDDGTNWTDAWAVTGQTGWFNGEVRQYIDPAPVWVDAGEDGVRAANKRVWAFYDAPNGVMRAGSGLSIVKTGTGSYNVVFDVPRQDINYAILMGSADMGYQYGSNPVVYWNSKTVDGFTIASYSIENRSRYDPLLSIEVIDASNDTLGGFIDAPIDGKIYARKNGKWVQVGGAGTEERYKAAARIDCTDPLAPTITSGFNVSGITRVKQGVYRVDFTSAIDPTKLAFNGGGKWAPATNNNDLIMVGVDRNDGVSTTSITINTATISANQGDGQIFDCDGWFSFELYDPAMQAGGGGSSSGGIGDEAPLDGKGYVRRDAEWEAPVLSDNTDIDFTTAPFQGQSLVYDAVSQKWKPGAPASARIAKVVQVGHSAFGDYRTAVFPNPPKLGNLLVAVFAAQGGIPGTPAGWTNLQAVTDPGGRVSGAIAYRMVDQVLASSNQVRANGGGDGDYGTTTVYEINIGGRAGADAIVRSDLAMTTAPVPYQPTDAALVLVVSVSRPEGSTVTMKSSWINDGSADGDNRNSWAYHQNVIAGELPDFGLSYNGASEYFTGVIYIDNKDNTIGEAPSDSKTYGRKNSAWAKVVEEAPSDGRQYARKDGAWAQVVASGAGSAGGNSKEGRVFVAGGTFNYEGVTPTFAQLEGCTVERVAQGRFKVTFDAPMKDTNYGVLASGKWSDNTDGAGNGFDIPQVGVDRGYSPALTQNFFYLQARSNNGTAYDARISFAVYESAEALTQILGGGINAAGSQGLANIRQAIKIAEVENPVNTVNSLNGAKFDYKIDWGGLVALAYHGQAVSSDPNNHAATVASYTVPAGKKVLLVDGWGASQNQTNTNFYGHRLFNVTTNTAVVSPNASQKAADGWVLSDGAMYCGNNDAITPSVKVIGVAGDTLTCQIWNQSNDGRFRMNAGVYILAVVDANTNKLADMTPDALIGVTAKNAILNYKPLKIAQIAAGAKQANNTQSVVFPTAPKAGNTILLMVATYSGAGITVPSGYSREVSSTTAPNQGFFCWTKTSVGSADTSIPVTINDGGSAMAYEIEGSIGNLVWNFAGSNPASYRYRVNDTLYGDAPLRFIIAEHDYTPAVGLVASSSADFTLDYNGSGSGNHAGIYGRVSADFNGYLDLSFNQAGNNFVGELTVTGSREIVPLIGETPMMEGQAGKVLAVNSTEDGLEWIGGGSGGSADYPDFEGNAGRVLAVNADEDGVEWVNGGSGGSSSASFAGALVKLTANEATEATTNKLVPWDVATYDTSSFWSAEQPTRLTVPAGVSYVRLTGQLTNDPADGQLYGTIYKNGAVFDVMPISDTETAGGDSVNFVSPVVPVVPGDYFEVNAYTQTARNLVVTGTWFQIEAVATSSDAAIKAKSTRVSARYWRVRAPDGVLSSTAWVGIGEMRWLAQDGTTNLATGGTPYASSIFNNTFPASAAFNGTNGTDNGWICRDNGKDGAWLAYDFGSAVSPYSISIAPVSNYVGGFADKYEIQFSLDGSTWFTTNVATFTTPGTADQYQTRSITEFVSPYAYGLTGGAGGGSLGDLGDVLLSPAPTDRQALVYDSASGKWKPGSVAASGGSIGNVLAVRETFAPPLASTFPVVVGPITTIDHPDFGLLVTATGTAANDVPCGIFKPKPTGTSWSVIGMIEMGSPNVSFSSFHLAVRNSATGRITSVGHTNTGPDGLRIEFLNWTTTGYDSVAIPNIVGSHDYQYWKIEYDGTNLKFALSNNSVTWYPIGQFAPTWVGAFDQVGLFMNAKVASPITLRCRFYKDSSTPARAMPQLISGGAPWAVTATGTAAVQVVPLPEANLLPTSVLVFVNGIKQAATSYTIEGSDLSLTTNEVGDAIEIQRAAATPNQTATVVSGTSDFTLSLSDLGIYKRVKKATAVTITVPDNATVAFPIGSQMNFIQTGDGAVVFAPAAGVTINSANTLATRKKFSGVTLTKVAANEWDLIGDTA